MLDGRHYLLGYDCPKLASSHNLEKLEWGLWLGLMLGVQGLTMNM